MCVGWRILKDNCSASFLKDKKDFPQNFDSTIRLMDLNILPTAKDITFPLVLYMKRFR